MAWTQLRMTRSAPPEPATRGADRTRTYVTALEQAEQMFGAAAAVSPVAQPILIFYGLSQAGRAVAAAAKRVARGSYDWRLSGHGISEVDLSLDLPDIGIFASGSKGSFVVLSGLLDSPVWEKSAATPLARLWDCLPENRHQPLRDGIDRLTPLLMVESNHNDPHALASATICYFPPHVVAAQSTSEVLQFLANFPDVQEIVTFSRVSTDADAPPEFYVHPEGWGNADALWRMPPAANLSSAARDSYMKEMTRLYLHERYFFPAVGSTGRSIHPLMAWWAVLHALSMLARYQPAEWARYTDVNSSTYSVAVEQLLETALYAIPELVLQAIQQVSG